jgi:hypothetical protein
MTNPLATALGVLADYCDSLAQNDSPKKNQDIGALIYTQIERSHIARLGSVFPLDRVSPQ